MTTMSDDGDRTCPLCAEEMDLTDQQLKPCKCGYEICVWCWHHIIEMAEKDGSEGRCPACRTPYDKQRIVGMAANCKRMVAEISAEKKQKSQKPKNKSSSAVEDRKHLSTVRVVQKNLVYIMGMPSNLSDETILERKECFGQYGKILKVSVSRQAGSTNQQAANSNTFNVYITYAREDEAVRCIQAVHNFVLEGKPLRACFGTTKYCYTWLRNMTCSNPECLYLHDIGSQEDSFTKDEIISAYTRSRVPQIATNNLQPRAGNVLPPPVDDVCTNGPASTKHSMKGSINNTTSHVKSSPIDINGPKFAVLPAAASWGSRASNCRTPASSLASSQVPLKQKTEVLNSPSSSSMVSSTKQISAWHDDAVIAPKVHDSRPMVQIDGRTRLLEPQNHSNGNDRLTKVSDTISGSAVDVDNCSGSAWDDDITTTKVPDGRHTLHINGRYCGNDKSRPSNATSVSDKPPEVAFDEVRHSAWDDDTVLASDVPELKRVVHNEVSCKSSNSLEPGVRLSRPSSLVVASKAYPDAVRAPGCTISCGLSQRHENRDNATNLSTENTDSLNMSDSGGAAHGSSSSCIGELTHTNAVINRNAESLLLGLSSVNLDTQLSIDHNSTDPQLSSVNDKCLVGNLGPRLEQPCTVNGAESLTSTSMISSSVIPGAHVSDWSLRLQKQASSPTEDRQMFDSAANLPSVLSYRTYTSTDSNHLTHRIQNGEVDNKYIPGDGAYKIKGAKINERESLLLNGHKEEATSSFVKSERSFEYPNTSDAEIDINPTGFGSTSNIRAVSVDKEEENIVSKILSPEFDPWDNSWSAANNFAKLLAQMSNNQQVSKQSSSWKPQNSNQSRFSFARQEYQPNLVNNSYRDTSVAQEVLSSRQDLYGKFVGNTLPVSSFERVSMLGSSTTNIVSDDFAGAMRTKVSAPPGFCAPNRAPPPPGFSSKDKYDHAFYRSSETQPIGGSLHNQSQANSLSNATDVEFIDPAILAVGKGRLPPGVNNTVLGSRSAFHPQFSHAESDPRIQLLMQQSISGSQDSSLQNHIGDKFLQLDDAYTTSRFPAPSSSLSPFAQLTHQQPTQILNSQWNGWNELQVGNSIAVSDVLRNERLGLNSYFPQNEEPKFHHPSSADIYNRAFGM